MWKWIVSGLSGKNQTFRFPSKIVSGCFFAAFGDDFWATEGCQHPAVSCEFFEVKRRLTDKRIDPHHFCVSLISGPLWPDFLFQYLLRLNDNESQRTLPFGRDLREAVVYSPPHETLLWARQETQFIKFPAGIIQFLLQYFLSPQKIQCLQIGHFLNRRMPVFLRGWPETFRTWKKMHPNLTF